MWFVDPPTNAGELCLEFEECELIRQFGLKAAFNGANSTINRWDYKQTNNSTLGAQEIGHVQKMHESL